MHHPEHAVEFARAAIEICPATASTLLHYLEQIVGKDKVAARENATQKRNAPEQMNRGAQ